MIRIFKYETKRLLLNKFFIGLCVINCAFAWYTLTSGTIAGIAHTAPFSPWSFGAYLASVMPISILTVLFLLGFFYSKKEKQTAALTAAAPVDPARYALIRLAVAALGFVFICTLTAAMCIIFYAIFFNYWDFSVFLLPALLTILPCFVFFLGAGNLLGRIHTGLLYGLMLITFAMSFIPMSGALSFIGVFGGNFYAAFPLSLPPGADGDPAFTLSAAFLVMRAVYFALGACFFAISVYRAPGKTATGK